MSIFSKIVVTILVLLSAFYIKETFFKDVPLNFLDKNKEEISLPKPVETQKLKEEEPSKEIVKQKEFVTVYFISTGKDGSSVFKKATREYSKGPKLDFAIQQLLQGPDSDEKGAGVYTEIPKGTRLINIEQQGSNIIINLSSDFQYGGGTDSIYSRMKQLIKTTLANSKNKNIYLYLDGKQVDMLGGEGIMITQPLSERSIDG